MTNEEKFKTPEERAKAFDKFCNGRKCEACPMVDMGTIYECAYSWLALEAEAAGEEVCHGQM